jgi:hypothetical protein
MLSLALVAEFDAQIGLSYLRAIHLNDSKSAFNSKRDRHENIGLYVNYSIGLLIGMIIFVVHAEVT